jgi:hypothetical protein
MGAEDQQSPRRATGLNAASICGSWSSCTIRKVVLLGPITTWDAVDLCHFESGQLEIELWGKFQDVGKLQSQRLRIPGGVL